jgi:DNA-binding response OmpR family regulator
VQTPEKGGTDKLRSNLSGIRVLVVEDKWQVAHAMKDFLEAEGMTVCGPAATVTAARRLSAEKPHVAVVDINLRDEMAYDLIHELQGQGICIVVVSGYAILPGVAGSAVAVLQKPFKPEELRAALQCCLDFVSRSEN